MEKSEQRRLVWNKRTIAWYLYDFANSFLFINTLLYFSQWIVVDNGKPDFWFSIALIVSSLLLIATSPYLGVVADRRGLRRPLLIWFTVLTIVCGALIQVFGAWVPGQTAKVLLALVAYGGWNIFYLLSFFLYNTFIKDLSDNRVVGKISGIGMGVGALGSMSGLLLTLPIVKGAVPALGVGGVYVFIPAAVLSLLLSIPMLLVVAKTRNHSATPGSAPEPAAGNGETVSYTAVYRQIWRDLRDTKRFPGVSRLLFAFYLFSNGILTMQAFSAVLVTKIIGADEAFKVMIFQIVTVGIVVGAIAGGALADRIGHKRLLTGTLVMLTVTTIGFAIFSQRPVAATLFGFFGLSLGSAWSVTRAFFSKLIPAEKKGQFFGLYALSERFAALIGPAVWGLVVFVGPEANALNYRLAVIAMAMFALAGLLVLRKMPSNHVGTPPLREPEPSDVTV